jgi:hypothetical protein
MVDKKQLDNVECINYWRSMVTKDATCTCEINARIAMVKAELGNNKEPCSPENWALMYGTN